MIYLETFKKYKFYNVTDQDVTDTGGTGSSRYIPNTVLVFQESENPQIGKEIFMADDIDTAKKQINLSQPIKDVFNDAVLRSQVQGKKSNKKDTSLSYDVERTRE